MYPNPATGVLYIRGKRHTASIVIKDLTGRLIRSLTVDPRLLLVQVPITDLHPGIYLLEINGTTFRITKE
ncbi:T9SS type A sorting domain-containing protein [Paraflavitalea speifideaquila]|uniref:T9SS type A sorting domain-containing protein n=1 Tax=Paraflavitalea speifideaquila TaxID=3076558 RepID=UPI00331306D5